jgi:hypothetical protein
MARNFYKEWSNSGYIDKDGKWTKLAIKYLGKTGKSMQPTHVAEFVDQELMYDPFPPQVFSSNWDEPDLYECFPVLSTEWQENRKLAEYILYAWDPAMKRKPITLYHETLPEPKILEVTHVTGEVI